jgi:pimeloyl-ACP methyl ester carboxylesterase
VVLDSGLGVDSTSTWAAVRSQVAKRTRVCLYDRAGMASSDPGPKPRTVETMAAELHALLDAADVEPPYVLAGASLGGMNAQHFAAKHPDEVAGVVLVDGMHPDLDRRIEPLLGRRGARDRKAFPPVPLIALQHGISFDPGGEPVPSIERMWGELQRDNAGLSPHGRVVVAERSHHRIAEDQPDVVVDAILEVVEAARKG